VYSKEGLIKVEIALVKGKRKFDKRETLKKKDAQREIDRVFKR
jgi:SsrA-binding protein